MIVKAKKYGNSHVFPIPKAILDLFDITLDTKFELKADKNGFVYRPIADNQAVIEDAEDQSIKEHTALLTRLAEK